MLHIIQYNTTKYIDENQDSETLKDMTKSGKRRPWREKKIDNVSYADILEILKIKKAYNVKQCGNVLEFFAILIFVYIFSSIILHIKSPQFYLRFDTLII